MAVYPTPKQAVAGSGGQFGPQYLKYRKHPKEWSEITLISVYEDQGRDFNTSATDAPQRWTLEYDGLTDDEAQILDTFWDAHQLHLTFTFVEPRDKPWSYVEGNTVTGVRFESYTADHDKVKTIQRRTVVLVKYP